MISDRISDAFAPRATERGRARPNLCAPELATFRRQVAVGPDDSERQARPKFAMATWPQASADCDQMLVRPRRIEVFYWLSNRVAAHCFGQWIRRQNDRMEKPAAREPKFQENFYAPWAHEHLIAVS